MRKKLFSLRRSGCPVNVALEFFGDSWSLLIIRDLMFKELRTFKEFLTAGEGIASNILSDRLLKLETAGIISRTQDPQDARRFIYKLTEKGIDLAPALVEIILWSVRYEETDAPPDVIRQMRTHRAQFIANVRKKWSAK